MIARHAAALLLGAVVALAAVAVHRDGSSGLPWGLALAAAGSVCTAWWLLGAASSRTTVSYAVGWLVVFTVAVLGRPEGDYAVAADVRGYGLMVSALLVLAFGVAGLRGPSQR